MTADKQLKAYIDRVLRLKEEQDTIGDDIREIYAEAKAEGYDKTIMGKLVAHLRRELKQGAGAVAEAESIFDTYLHAYQRASGTPVAIAHTHEEKFDAETGEILEDINPRLVKQVVDGMQTEAGRAALIAAVDILIEQEEAEEEFHTNPEEEGEAKGASSVEAEDRAEGDADRQRSPEAGTTDGGRQGVREQEASAPVPASNPETVGGFPVAAAPTSAEETGGYSSKAARVAVENVVDKSVTVVGTESGTVSNGSRPADPAVSGGEPGIPSSDDSGEKMETGSNPVPGRRDVKSLHSNAESERATNTNSEIDPSEDREEGHSLDGNADANAGGGHVNAQSEAAQRAGALVKPAPAHKPLRPLCRNPGEHCGGYGSTHCASCIRASKQTEVAA